MFWIFSRERRQARSLSTLAKQSVARTGLLLRQRMSDQDRTLITEWRRQRLGEIDALLRFVRGRTTAHGMAVNPMNNAATLRHSLEAEAGLSRGSSAALVKHIRSLQG